MGWKHMMRAGILPGWLGLENMLSSLIAKLALCCRMRSSPGCLASLTCSRMSHQNRALRLYIHTDAEYSYILEDAYLQLWL